MTADRETLVAWYGDKRTDFAAWLDELQHLVLHELGDHFVPYVRRQIHATCIELGAVATDLARRDAAFEHWVCREFAEPMRVRFGGDHGTDRTSLSRGRPRRERRFSVQGDKVVIIGWPEDDGRLGAFRRACESHGYRHTYHDSADTPDDDDCYLRLGMLRGAPPQHTVQSLEHEVRNRLATREREIVVDIATTDLRIARYTDPTLPTASTSTRSLAVDHAPPGA